ncbi:MAG: CDC27 family protein [Nonlabens ulvanivorans]|uniref:tetratricopeptide repeat protein n=1 Tax=Nonlabens ulvanivorans TaxID=906888 RepID=UPI0032666E0A
MNLFGNSITTLELFESNYEPYRNVMGGIERGEEIKEDLISKAFYTYEIKDYTTAAILFEQLYETDQQSMYLFYHANAQLGKGNTQKAISLYKQHQNVQDDFYARSRWYLALAYLKNDQIQESIAVLEGISKVKSYNYVKARELLLSLEGL